MNPSDLSPEVPPEVPPASGFAPDWPAPAGVRAWCSTRMGGVSKPPWAQANLGDHVGDAPAAVAENRRRYSAALAGARPVFMRQVHGCAVLRLQPTTPQNCCADAACTDQPGLACSVMVADCLPVLLCDAQGHCVAAAHAGWRGLLAGVLTQTLHEFWALSPVSRAQAATNTIAWLGPCIGPAAFEVGTDVQAAFSQAWPRASVGFKPGRAGHAWADLAALARLQLADLGVRQVFGNDSSAAWCTHTQASRFFSHRRDGRSGRFAASVWLDGAAAGGQA